MRLTSVAASPERVVIGTSTGRIVALDPDSGAVLEDAMVHRGTVWSLAITPTEHGPVVASCGDAGGLGVQTARGPHEEVYRHAGPLRCCAWSPDGRRLVFGAEDGTIGVRQVGRVQLEPPPAGEARPALWAIDAGDGGTRVTGDAAGVARHYGPFGGLDATWTQPRSLMPGIRQLRYAPHEPGHDPDRVALTTGSEVTLWPLDGSPGWRFDADRVGRSYAVAWSPDGRVLAAGFHRRVVLLVPETGEVQRWCPVGHTDSVRGLAFVDDLRLVSIGDDGTVVRYGLDLGSVDVWPLVGPDSPLPAPVRDVRDGASRLHR